MVLSWSSTRVGRDRGNDADAESVRCRRSLSQAFPRAPLTGFQADSVDWIDFTHAAEGVKSSLRSTEG